MAHEWFPLFLKSLAKDPNVTRACKRAKVTRKAAYDARKSDPEFAEAWDDALDQSTDDLVGEAYRRAFKGTLKPVYQGGVRVGKVREYSDTLAIFLLKCHRRGVYGDKLQTDLTTGGQAFQTVLYLPENGRDGDGAAGDPTPAGPADGVPGQPG